MLATVTSTYLPLQVTRLCGIHRHTCRSKDESLNFGKCFACVHVCMHAWCCVPSLVKCAFVGIYDIGNCCLHLPSCHCRWPEIVWYTDIGQKMNPLVSGCVIFLTWHSKVGIYWSCLPLLLLEVLCWQPLPLTFSPPPPPQIKKRIGDQAVKLVTVGTWTLVVTILVVRQWTNIFSIGSWMQNKANDCKC